ncbi:glycine cleavage system protein GcvH [Polycyclovorans algicola]|uniref:glycine cleavage system protein GcvH n=1 Tax=Polycyclovorans algicola TaxID=616992 RepID=UPI0004A7795F|nr:glycine cleavage system protein GcvH [Polycyclovorans algicola]
MSQIPENLKYVASHEWVRVESDGSLTIGITDHAQAALGDLVFVEAPEAGRVLKAGDSCAVVESVKAASDVYAPVAGTVTAANPALTDAPEMLNSDPYGEAWLWKMQPANVDEVAGLLDAAGYAKVLADQ